MKVKCISNNVSSLPKELLKTCNTSYEKFPLTLGKEYVVYALSYFYNNLWYSVCDEHHKEYNSYPIWRPCLLFDISDSRISRYWIFSFKKDNQNLKPVFSFPEWANEEFFYGNLVEGETREQQIFNSYRQFMDLEFPDNSILTIAEVGNDSWLICPNCIDGWESANTQDAMVICPKCKKIMHNPRYKDELPRLPDIANLEKAP